MGKINNSTITVEIFNILSAIDRITSHKNSKDVDNLNNTINHFEPTDIYILLYTANAKYTSFSGTHSMYTKIDICWAIKQVSNVKLLKL